jgi:hypothetical protein
MTLLAALALSSWMSPTQEISVTGPPTHYAPGVMETVAVNRGYIQERAAFEGWLSDNGLAGMIAVPRCGDLGRVVVIRGERFLIGDCAKRNHYPTPFVAEVGWQTARRWLEKDDWPQRITVWYIQPRIEARPWTPI